MKNKTVDIMGIPYSIEYKQWSEDEELRSGYVGGYVDESVKEIVIAKLDEDCLTKIKRPDVVMKKGLRHEIIHATLIECGIHQESTWAADEECIDWIARMFGILLESFADAECLPEGFVAVKADEHKTVRDALDEKPQERVENLRLEKSEE